MRSESLEVEDDPLCVSLADIRLIKSLKVDCYSPTPRHTHRDLLDLLHGAALGMAADTLISSELALSSPSVVPKVCQLKTSEMTFHG